MKQKILKLSVCALLCALSVVLMLLGCVIQALDLSVAIAAGLTVAVAMIEYGTGYSVMLYFATSVLAFVLLPAKTPALFYILMGGIYPIIKALLERMKSRKTVFALKLIGFNIFYTCLIAAGKFLLNINDPIFSFNIFVYALGNVTFILYDIAFTRLVTLYVKRIRRKLK
ncbi:MAG: hypothetical protein E7674_05740 [Ruminococcaceae bacterium]|nr:hypothetical protein [Oscillospiraceae bacterium]MBQ3599347.1 hypothetical protein [Clostridia bacterium]MBR2914682.1 hypothetical protein [Clostridia bacterium]